MQPKEIQKGKSQNVLKIHDVYTFMRLVRLMWSSASESTPVQSCYSQLNQAWRTSKNKWANSNSKYQPFRIDSDAALHMNLNSIWVMWTMASFFPASHDRGFAAQFLPQTTRKKTLWHPGYRTSFHRCTMCKKKNPSFKILQRNMRT